MKYLFALVLLLASCSAAELTPLNPTADIQAKVQCAIVARNGTSFTVEFTSSAGFFRIQNVTTGINADSVADSVGQIKTVVCTAPTNFRVLYKPGSAGSFARIGYVSVTQETDTQGVLFICLTAGFLLAWFFFSPLEL